jgi:hypothetical protein
MEQESLQDLFNVPLSEEAYDQFCELIFSCCNPWIYPMSLILGNTFGALEFTPRKNVTNI